MSEFAREIVARGTVFDAQGVEYPLHSHTGLDQCEFLAKLVREHKAKVALEVGLAYGISSLFICDALRCADGGGGAKLISMDPVQADPWHDVGLSNLNRAGFGDMLEFHRAASHSVLPRLLDQGVKIDFAYVDSGKIFDVLLVDAYFLARLLNVGGILVFDDCDNFLGVHRVARHVAQWPHFKVHAVHLPRRPTLLRTAAAWASNLVPYRSKLLSEEVVAPSFRLGVNAHCVAFQKVTEDRRRGDR